MGAIQFFNFESHDVRVVTDINGEPLFVGKDVCQALGYANHSDAIKQHCKGVAKRYPLQTAGGVQEVRVLAEPDVMRLIVSSTLPAAVAFERLVFEEILPTIRKTGSYAAPGSRASMPARTQDRVAALLLLGDAVARVPGVNPGIALAAALTCAHEDTGLPVEALRRALPAANEPLCALNATAIGKLLGPSAKATNQRLAANGFQVRNDRDEWELTEVGYAWGEAMPYSRNGHSGYQILWNPAVAEELKDAA